MKTKSTLKSLAAVLLLSALQSQFAIAFAATNLWVGDGVANQWNLVAPNWTNGVYVDGEHVIFDDAGSNNVPVDISVAVSPGSVFVNATKDYTFSGADGLAGGMGLTKMNTGELKLATSNIYSGVTTVSAGKLTIQNNNSLGSTAGSTIVTNTGVVQIDGGGLIIPEPLNLFVPVDDQGFGPVNSALDNLANTNALSGSITLGVSTPLRSTAGLLTLNSATAIAGPGGLSVIGAGDVRITSGIASSVGTVQAYGPGRLSLLGVNSSSGGINILCNGIVAVTNSSGLGPGQTFCSCGTLEINGNATLTSGLRIWGGKIRASGGTVTYSSAGLLRVHSSYGGSFETVGATDQLIFNSAIMDDFGSAFATLTVSGPGTVVLNSGSTASSAYIGYWGLNSGTLKLNHVDALTKRPIFLNGGVLQTGVDAGGVFSDSVQVGGDVTIRPGRNTSGAGVSNYFGSLSFGPYQLTVTPGANLTAGSTAALGFDNTLINSDASFNVQNSGGVNARVTLIGAVNDSFSTHALIKNGNGTLVLLADNTYDGETVISNGTLHVANTTGSATGTGDVTVYGGGTLMGNGRISGSVTVKPGGTLAAGASIGALVISNSLTFEADATNLVEVNLATSTNDIVLRLTNVVYAGTLIVSNVGPQAFTNGAVFKLFDSLAYSGAFAAILPATPGAGLGWNASTMTSDGTLRIMASCSAFSITNATLPNATEGAAYTVTLRATNGTAPYTFAVTSGTLPGNLALAAGGVLSGTATNVGSYPFTLTATGADGCAVGSNYVLAVVCPTITVSPSSLPDFVENSFYFTSITASGGTAPRTFEVTSGTLPPGMSLETNGIFSGTFTNAGTFAFTITATDAGGCPGSQEYTMTIYCAPPTITPATLPEGTIGVAYNQTLTRNGGHAPYSFGLTAGDLPGGLILSGGGTLAGTPTNIGFSFFTIGITNAAGCEGSMSYSLWIRNTRPMLTARYNHTATLLSNGKVLVAGGKGTNDAFLASAELYDPATGIWTATTAMNNGRYSHTATLLTNGQVLVAAGFGDPDGYLASAELYDPTSETWTNAAPLNTQRYGHSATRLADGRVLIAGGYCGCGFGDIFAEVYDPATGTWTGTPTMSMRRWFHTATLLPNGKVLVAGGFPSGAFSGALTNAEVYDPAGTFGSWTTITSMTARRAVHTAALLPNGKVLVAGGAFDNFGGYLFTSAELYNPPGETWAATGASVASMVNQTATLLPTGNVLVAGGAQGGFVSSDADLYNPTTAAWSATAPMSAARTEHTATLLNNGRVLIAGGRSASTPLFSVELYDPVSGTWTANGAPVVMNPIPDQGGTYGSGFSYTFPANTFGDPDPGQALTYSASNLPIEITLDGPTRTLSGTPTNSGTFAVTITTTDNGAPPLGTNDTFNIVVAKAPLVITANNTNRPYGEPNPPLTGTLVGVVNGDNITANFTTTATLSSPPGDYPIIPTLQDPDTRLGNYTVTTNLGIFGVAGVALEFGGAAGSPTICWPTNAAAFILEYTDELTPPIVWQPVASGMTTNDSDICVTVSPGPTVPSRFYRLHLP